MESLYDKINSLTDARTHKDLTGKLQEILRLVVFYLSQTDSLGGQQEQEWRDMVTRTLRKDAHDEIVKKKEMARMEQKIKNHELNAFKREKLTANKVSAHDRREKLRNEDYRHH